MASYLSLVIMIAVAVFISVSSARVIPAEPVSLMLDAYGNPVLFLREKRAPPTNPIMPHRAMMFTGYYRPTRRSSAGNGNQVAGVFAQGNAVSGGSYLGPQQVPYLKRGPEPIEEPEISSAQAEAAPGPEITPEIYEQEAQPEAHEEPNDAVAPPEEQHEIPISDPEPLPYDFEAPGPTSGAETPEGHAEEASGKPATPPVKKGKKTPVVEDEDDDEDDFEEDETYVPFLPGKGNKRRGGPRVPNLNNFFPMMFSFPGFSGRRGSSSGSPPGVVTAIANSYSTGKGGVASSVASAYGGAPPGKKARRAPTAEE